MLSDAYRQRVDLCIYIDLLAVVTIYLAVHINSRESGIIEEVRNRSAALTDLADLNARRALLKSESNSRPTPRFARVRTAISRLPRPHFPLLRDTRRVVAGARTDLADFRARRALLKSESNSRPTPRFARARAAVSKIRSMISRLPSPQFPVLGYARLVVVVALAQLAPVILVAAVSILATGGGSWSADALLGLGVLLTFCGGVTAMVASGTHSRWTRYRGHANIQRVRRYSPTSCTLWIGGWAALLILFSVQFSFSFREMLLIWGWGVWFVLWVPAMPLLLFATFTPSRAQPRFPSQLTAPVWAQIHTTLDRESSRISSAIGKRTSNH